jgi:ABC-type nitrate/sulfonate/bicarbonate transport system ATPase subunit
MHAKIVVRDVRKSYATDKGPLAVLAGIDFSVSEGEFVALVGPSGCGKTTLLNNIAGFEKPDHGEIIVSGSPVTGPSRQGITISQLGSVFPWLTVQQNLMFALKGMPKNDTKRIAQHYINLVGLKGFEQSFPYQISGGMLKRVELARALAVRSEILYMDEPFAALDALTRIRLRSELLQILSHERHTCLLVTHDVDEALHLADRIFVLGARPTKVESIVEVAMPHPRRLRSAEMLELKENILQKLGVDTEIDDGNLLVGADNHNGLQSADRARAPQFRSTNSKTG